MSLIKLIEETHLGKDSVKIIFLVSSIVKKVDTFATLRLL